MPEFALLAMLFAPWRSSTEDPAPWCELFNFERFACLQKREVNKRDLINNGIKCTRSVFTAFYARWRTRETICVVGGVPLWNVPEGPGRLQNIPPSCCPSTPILYANVLQITTNNVSEGLNARGMPRRGAVGLAMNELEVSTDLETDSNYSPALNQSTNEQTAKGNAQFMNDSWLNRLRCLGY